MESCLYRAQGLWSEKRLVGSSEGGEWGRTKIMTLKEGKEDSQDGMVWGTFLGEREVILRISAMGRVRKES